MKSLKLRGDDRHLAAAGDDLALDERAVRSTLLPDITLDFQTKAGDAVHLLRRRQHPHAPHAKILQNLRAHAEGPQHLAISPSVRVRRRIRLALAWRRERPHRIQQIAR